MFPHSGPNPSLGSSLVKTNKIHAQNKRVKNTARKTLQDSVRKVALKEVDFMPKAREVCSMQSPINLEKSTSHFVNNFEHDKGRKRRVSNCVFTNHTRINKKRCDESSMKLQSEGVKNLHFELLKDSGFSSCSSQERTPMEEKNLQFCDVSSQEIVLNVNKIEDKDKNARTGSEALRANSQPVTDLPTNAGLESDRLTIGRIDKSRSEGMLELHSSDLSATLANSENNLGFCIFCLSEPKNSVFVHSNFVHLCCCYKCAIKVWKQRKACPICNCKVKNVMKLFVH